MFDIPLLLWHFFVAFGVIFPFYLLEFAIQKNVEAIFLISFSVFSNFAKSDANGDGNTKSIDFCFDATAITEMASWQGKENLEDNSQKIWWGW